MKKLFLAIIAIAFVALIWWLAAPKGHAQEASRKIIGGPRVTITNGDGVADNSTITSKTGTAAQEIKPDPLPSFTVNTNPSIGPVGRWLACRRVYYNSKGQAVRRQGCRYCSNTSGVQVCRRVNSKQYNRILKEMWNN